MADACLRRGVALRIAPTGLAPLLPGMKVAGPARPVRHYGSVDVFIESVARARPGEVLVIDNSGRTDEGCIGDLTVLEVQAGGLAGVLLWGLHRDTAELRGIGFPVFSYGTTPAGPQRLDLREPEVFESARFGSLRVTAADYVFADGDGALFVPQARLEEILATARTIWETERKQADAVRAGRLLREQLRLAEYLEKRRANPALTFRQHLREIRGAIEE
ncbi:MAG: RraA family protein [Burkholderiales bacterium]